MTDLTIRPPSQFNGSQAAAIELGKMLGLVAPITMSADQQTLWLASAVDALKDIRASEIAEVSMEVRRTVTRPSQIVPEIARLVAEKRARQARLREYDKPAIAGPPLRIPVMDRRGQPMSDEDTAELNAILESVGATKRYHSDGTKYDAIPTKGGEG